MNYKTKAFLLRLTSVMAVIASLAYSGLWEGGTFSFSKWIITTVLCLATAYICTTHALRIERVAHFKRNKALAHKKATKIALQEPYTPTVRRAA